MNVNATLGISQGHHPANNRSAIPTRAYESGSGHGHDAAPAGHPHPPRPPPRPGNPREPHALPGRLSRRAAARHQGRLRRRCASAARPRTPGTHPRDLAAIKAMGPARHAPAPEKKPGEPSDHGTSQAHQQQKLDRPLHMSAHLSGRGADRRTRDGRRSEDPAGRAAPPSARAAAPPAVCSGSAGQRQRTHLENTCPSGKFMLLSD